MSIVNNPGHVGEGGRLDGVRGVDLRGVQVDDGVVDEQDVSALGVDDRDWLVRNPHHGGPAHGPREAHAVGRGPEGEGDLVRGDRQSRARLGGGRGLFARDGGRHVVGEIRLEAGGEEPGGAASPRHGGAAVRDGEALVGLGELDDPVAGGEAHDAPLAEAEAASRLDLLREDASRGLREDSVGRGDRDGDAGRLERPALREERWRGRGGPAEGERQEGRGE